MGESIWFQDFHIQYEEKIISYWLNEIEKQFPGHYNLTELYQNGKVYFQLLKDINSPVKQHPLYDIIPQMCKYHADRETPVEHLFHSSHIWREALLEYIYMYMLENRISLEEFKRIVPALHKRIDEVQRDIIRIYWHYAKALLQQKEKIINELHNDRLAMLGRMSASMAHEIRNPLTAIEGFIKLIRSELLTLDGINLIKINSYLDIIQHEYSGVYRQISGFLSFSKNNVNEEPFVSWRCEDIIQSVIELVNPRLIDENITLQVSLHSDYSMIVQKNAIQQVLSNLINNSIDALSSLDDAKLIKIHSYEDIDNYYLDLTDNGEGIPIEVQENIFNPFITSKSNGTGLGLAICKQLMDKNGGTISFTSKQGRTTFTLSFIKK